MVYDALLSQPNQLRGVNSPNTLVCRKEHEGECVKQPLPTAMILLSPVPLECTYSNAYTQQLPSSLRNWEANDISSESWPAKVLALNWIILVREKNHRSWKLLIPINKCTAGGPRPATKGLQSLPPPLCPVRVTQALGSCFICSTAAVPDPVTASCCVPQELSLPHC